MIPQADAHNRERQLRLWPGIAIFVPQLLVQLLIPFVAPDNSAYAVIVGVVGALATLIWWLFFSRAPLAERWGAIALMAVAVIATRPILDKSIAGGMMGMMFPISVIPILSLALVAWAALTQRLSALPRRLALVAITLIVCGGWTLLRTEGITADGHSQFAWRWSPSHEQQLLARADLGALPLAPVAIAPPTEIPKIAVESPAATTAPRAALPAPSPSSLAHTRNGGDWPGFRGPNRDDAVTGVQIKTDWATSPPVELWRRPVGPGWSSFAVRDGLVYTQEQRGESEVVSCYNATNGAPVWAHRDAARFWESNAGAGPRATPTLHEGRVYTLGATGIVNALDANTGARLWTRNAAADTGAKLPGWGFSGSPLVTDDLVIVAASGRLAAYELASGKPRWTAKTDGGSYSSPHLLTIDGVAQVVLLNDGGASSLAPTDGKPLWKHAWPGVTMLQPVLTADGGILITSGDMGGGMGTRRLAVAHSGDEWTAKEVWTSPGLKPYFNDIVVRDGHAFGFDGGILSCIDLQDGKRKWKGGRYGHGQLLLLKEQALLLVLSEEGEVALVSATPDKFTELGRFRAMGDKTWNHPVVAGDLLLVRNGQEMVAYRLTLAGS